jgi:hypothetical protein
MRLVNAFEAAEFGREVLEVGGRTAQADHLHAQVVVEVDVHGGDHPVRVGVLEVEHLIGQPRPVVVVNQGQAGGHVRGVRRPRGGGQLLPEQLADRLAPRGQLPVFDELVERVEQVLLQRHGEPHQFGHGRAP